MSLTAAFVRGVNRTSEQDARVALEAAEGVGKARETLSLTFVCLVFSVVDTSIRVDLDEENLTALGDVDADVAVEDAVEKRAVQFVGRDPLGRNRHRTAFCARTSRDLSKSDGLGVDAARPGDDRRESVRRHGRSLAGEKDRLDKDLRCGATIWIAGSEIPAWNLADLRPAEAENPEG